MQSASRIGRPHVVGKTSSSPEMMVVFSPRQGPAEESGSLRSGHLGSTTNGCRLGCRADRFNDVLIPGAPAKISLKPSADAFLARVRFAAKQLQRTHDHAWGTKTALQRVMLAKRRQQPMLAVTGLAQAFDRVDRCAVRLDCQHRA